MKVPDEVKFWEPAETTAGNEKSNKEHAMPASRREQIVFTVRGFASCISERMVAAMMPMAPRDRMCEPYEQFESLMNQIINRLQGPRTKKRK